MIREGSYERVLGFLASNPGILDVSHVRDKAGQGIFQFSKAQEAGYDQSRNIRNYSGYLEERAAGYKYAKEDFSRGKSATIALFKQEPFDESKLKLIQSLQRQIDQLLSCQVRPSLF